MIKRLLRLAPLLAVVALAAPAALPQTVSIDLGTGRG